MVTGLKKQCGRRTSKKDSAAMSVLYVEKTELKMTFTVVN